MQPGPPSGIDSARRKHLGGAVVAKPHLPAVGGGVAAGLDDAVVMWADQHQVRQRGHTTQIPGHHMMGLTSRGWRGAAREHTATIAGDQGGPHRGGHQPAGPAHIQHLAATAQHHWDELGVAAGTA